MKMSLEDISRPLPDDWKKRKMRRDAEKAAKKVLHRVKYRRKSPYTEIGIRRMQCFRTGCENRATRQWQICSDENTFRPICDSCDIELNSLVLEFMQLEGREDMIKKYKEKIVGGMK